MFTSRPRSAPFVALFATFLGFALRTNAPFAAPLDSGSATPAIAPGTWSASGTVRASVRVGDTLYVGGDFWQLSMPTGNGLVLDARNGQLRPPVSPVGQINEQVMAVVSDGEEGWFIGGNFTTVGGQPHAGLAHVLSDGSVAPWAPVVSGEVRALLMLNGTLYVGGYFTAVNGHPRGFLAAFDAESGVLLRWNPTADWIVTSFAGRGSTVYVGGAYASIAGVSRSGLAALDATTGASLDWNPGCGSWPTCLALQGTTLYVGGNFTTIGGLDRHYLGAVDASTGAVIAWNPQVVLRPYDPGIGEDAVSAIAVRDTMVYVGGFFGAVGGRTAHCVAAVSTRTGRAVQWVPSIDWGYFYYGDPIILAIAVRGSTVCLGGSLSTGYTNYRWNFAAVDATTGVDLDWSAGTDLAVTAIAMTDSSIYVGGVFTRALLWRTHAAAFDLRTGAPTSWSPSPNGPVYALAADPGRRAIYMGGAFTPDYFVSTANLAAIDPVRGVGVIDPATGTTIAIPSPNGEVDALACDGASLYAGGAFTALGDPPVPRSHLAQIVAASGELTAWAPEADGPVDALALDGASVYAGGRFATVGGVPRAHLAQIDATTGGATAWRADADGAPRALCLDRGTLYAGGEFATVGGVARPFLAGLDAASGAPLPWMPAPDAPVSALAMRGHSLIAGGEFSHIGGAALTSLAALDPATGLALPWSPDPDGDVRTVTPLATGVAAGGAFTTIGGLPHARLALVSLEDPASAGVAADTRGTALHLAPCSPNPARGAVTLRFTLPSPQRVRLAVFDVQGRRVLRPLAGEARPAGAQEVRLDVAGWRAGVYLVRLEAGGERRVRRLLVVR